MKMNETLKSISSTLIALTVAIGLAWIGYNIGKKQSPEEILVFYNEVGKATLIVNGKVEDYKYEVMGEHTIIYRKEQK